MIIVTITAFCILHATFIFHVLMHSVLRAVGAFKSDLPVGATSMQ